MSKRKKDKHSVEDKLTYYGARINDPKLSEKQREYARKRIGELSGNKSCSTSSPKQTRSSINSESAKNPTYAAGVGFGAAKAGARVLVKPENKDTFREGVKAGRGLPRGF